MENRERLYNELRQLYSGKEIKYDSFRTGRQIEKLVNVLIEEIVSPYEQESEVRIGKHVFDGRVKIGRWRSILYEIFAGNLSAFRYDRLLELVKSIYLTGRTYFLVIARGFSDEDEKKIYKLASRIEAKNVELCFIDYEVLISLHRFSSKIQTEPSYEDVKRLNGLFLRRLLEYSPIIREEAFDEAMAYARQQYRVSTTTLRARAGFRFPSVKYEIDESRLQNLEELLEKALIEIRRLRKELQRRSSG